MNIADWAENSSDDEAEEQEQVVSQPAPVPVKEQVNTQPVVDSPPVRVEEETPAPEQANHNNEGPRRRIDYNKWEEGLFIVNLSYKANEQEVGEFFVGGGCRVRDVVFDEQNRGSATIYFEDLESFKLAHEADGAKILDRPIKITKKNRSRPGDNKMMKPRNGDRKINDSGESWQRKPMSSAQTATENEGRVQRPSTRPVRSERQPPVPSANTERPALNLKPRTVPLDAEYKPPSSIFGEGKPREDKVAEDKKVGTVTEAVSQVTIDEPIKKAYVVEEGQFQEVKKDNRVQKNNTTRGPPRTYDSKDRNYDRKKDSVQGSRDGKFVKVSSIELMNPFSCPVIKNYLLLRYLTTIIYQDR